MAQPTLRGPSCHSCGILIMKAEEFGREKNGVIRTDYCRYCYDKGVFLDPDITFAEMVEKLAKTIMTSRRNMTEELAREKATEQITGLKRWTAK
ncbi:MAG: zinc ribbon domain-containing protein [Deltaproteobacteria bacterium]|nr:zinc ribbon domain-containing protein [Deltaproteobacteria bacterium]